VPHLCVFYRCRPLNNTRRLIYYNNRCCVCFCDVIETEILKFIYVKFRFRNIKSKRGDIVSCCHEFRNIQCLCIFTSFGSPSFYASLDLRALWALSVYRWLGKWAGKWKQNVCWYNADVKLIIDIHLASKFRNTFDCATLSLCVHNIVLNWLFEKYWMKRRGQNLTCP